MARVSLRTLGTVRIEAGQRSIGPGAGRPFALVLYLMCRRGQPTPRRILQELLFPGRSESRSTHSLRQLVYRVRQLGIPVDTDSGDVQIAAADAWIDWSDILERGELGNPDMELVAQGLFPGFSPDVSEGYREWFEAERSAVRLRLSRAVGLQLTQLRRAGRWDLVDSAARALLALDPLSEEGTLARAEALAASGSKTAALGLIDDYLKELGDDQANLRLTPSALRRRISERLPEMGHRAQDDRIFVGREDAMRMLSAAGAAARAGTQQTVLVWGEPGIGKTRLLQEYKALACLQGAVAFQVTCQPHDVFRPLGALSDLVAQLLDAPGGLGCDPEARFVLGRLTTGNHKNQEEYASNAVAEETSLASIATSVDDLLSAIASECPLLILVDDVQWLDRTSLNVFLAIVSAKVLRRAMIILASRERAILANDDGLAHDIVSIRLNPLSGVAALELSRSILSVAQMRKDIEVEQAILEQARGNPLFIRLLSLHYATAGDTQSFEATIGDIFQRRLEQLSVDARRVLESCVVLGKHSTHDRLERLLGFSRLRLLASIEELDDRGLIELRGGSFVSGHALVAAAVSRRISTSVFCALHGAAAELLFGELTPLPGGSLPWDCAEHWRLAKNPAKAVAVLMTCARRALEFGRPADALSTLKRALELNTPDETRLEIVETALLSLTLRVDWRDTKELIAERNSLVRRLGRAVSAHDEFEIIEAAADYHVDGDPRPNIDRLRQCVLEHTASPEHRVGAARQLMMFAELTLDYELARFAFETTAHCRIDPMRRAITDALYHSCFGDANRARLLSEELAHDAVLEKPGHLNVMLNVGYIVSRVGNPVESERILRNALRLAQESGLVSAEMHASLFLARLAWTLGRTIESESWLEHFTDLFATHADRAVLGEVSVLGAKLALAQKKLGEAEARIQAAKSCRQSGLPLPHYLVSACEVELRLARDLEPCTATELDSLVDLHVRARRIGCQDEATCAVVKALIWYGRTRQASELVRSYFRHRRDGFAPQSQLAHLAHELGTIEEGPVLLSR